MNKVVHFLLTLLIMFAVSIAPAQALLKGGTWQELNSTTGAVNGTAPLADGATIPLYQGSMLLDPTKTYDIEFTAMPRDFSADASSTSMRAVNSTDTEGDLFTDPPSIAWENQEPPTMSLVWADAATPDTPLSPQPILNQTFCAQNLAGRQLVAWAQVEDETNVPALWLYTRTGVPNNAVIPLLSPKVTLNIKPAVSDPVSVSGDHIDANFAASKVKAGESITLTVSTKACNGDVAPNAAFVIRREDAINRQGMVNNANPVRVGDTELTTTQTEYHGVTDGQGNATVVVTQEQGPGVKTRLIVSSQSYPTLTDNVDVIFTTITSPDSDKANMYGHMLENATATLNGTTYTFTRPKLAAETSGNGGTVVDTNETWAQFTWSGADNHCDILPDAEQLVALRHEHSALATYTGWPVTGDAEYWSSTKDQINDYHAAVHMNSASVVRAANSDTLLVSCVDKAQPAAHPQITLSPEGPYKAQVGESIDLVMTVVDRDTQKPLPYRYMELFIDPAKNRKGEHQDAWDNQRVTINTEDMRASSPEHYTGVTDANGQVHLTLKHDSGLGVETPIRIVMPDDEGGSIELPFSVIFTVITSPDVDGANMWGHMQGVVDAGNLYRRPLLAVETSHKDGQFSENNEEWATFNSVEKATAQCGIGQVPDQSSLAHLYSEHAGGKMESEHGWPTEDYYIAADSDASGTAHVNLENGDSGKFTNQPNYLTCSANEMVAVLDVYFNDDPATKNSDMVAKVGEQIKLNIHSRNALNGMPIAYTDFTVTMANGKRRDGLTTGFTDTSNGQMLFDDVGYLAGQAYHGITDANGDATIILTQPKGVGLLTPLSIAPVDSLISTPVSRSVKFTVATSPDTPKAKMWGHMADTITVGDLTFERPKLADEVTPERTQAEANETWARVLHPDAAGNPDKGGCAANRLPRIDQLEALYNANSDGVMKSTQGWPTLLNYWSSTFQSATTWKLISLFSGSEFANANVSIYASCLASDNPAAASITIEPVDASQWYDGSGVHAVKAKKGDTMQLKVTVKDASGNPIPEAPFVLTRGDGYDRRGEKYTASEGNDQQGIVTPVVIDGESLAWTTTKMGMLTGADGTRIISVTRPDTHGTRTAIIAALYENAAVSASIDTIFTVITSPDVDVARMWGHMLPSLTAADGAEYQRPQLYAELANQASAAQYTEDNEIWAGLYGPDSSKTDPAVNCAAGYFPSVEALDSLYSKYPNRTIKTAQGWPINRSYWSGSSSGSLTGGKPRSYYIVDLDDDSRRGVVNDGVNDRQYQICATTPKTQATQITLTSTLATDDTIQAVKAKNSESIPLLVTTTDAAGNPVPYTTFSLKRDAGTPRKADYPFTNSYTMTMTQSGGATQEFAYSSSVLYGATGANGTLALSLDEPGGVGVKSVVTASLYDTPTVTSSLPAVFTVITSPNSDKATYWGHMPETFTNSKGVEFARPLLRAELSSTTDTSGYLANGENWYTWSRYPNLYQDSASPCDRLGLPTMDELKTLYADYPQGGLTAAFGLPVAGGKYWGAGDSKVNDTHSTNNFQYIRLNTGETTTTSTNTATAQLCLAKRRVLSIALTSSAMNAEKSAALAKKGEKIPLTVTVTDGAGTPQPNVPIRLGRGNYSQNRAGGNENGSNSDMLLTPIAPPADAKAFAYHYSGEQLWYWYGTTDESGRVQFELTQDNTPGLKTRLEAMLPDNPPTVSDMDAIFTVITSPDSVKAKYWGHMPETVTNSAGVEFRRPLLAAEMTSNSGTYLDNNETWPLVTIANTQKAGATGCDAQYQPLLNDLQTLYGDNPNSAIGTAFGWPVGAGKSWLAVDQETGTGYYQYLRLDTGAKGRSSSTSVTGAQVCLVEPHTSTPASITLTSTAMDGAKNAAVVEKGSAMPLTVTVKDSSGNPVANVGFTLSRGDSKNRAGTVVTDGDVAADAGADDLMLKALTPASASQSMTTTGIVFTGTTGSDGTATFTLNQDKSLGLKTPLTVKLTDNTTLHASLDVIFMVLTSPDTDKALFWGNMADTTSVNGKTLHRPWLQAELLSGVTPVFTNGVHTNNEYWAMAHTVDNTKWDIAKQCGSLSKAPDNNDLLTLYHSISSLGWPTQGYPYLSKSTSSGGMYCGVDENTRNQNCAIKPASSAGYATCVD